MLYNLTQALSTIFIAVANHSAVHLLKIHIAVVFSLDGGGGCIGSVEGLGVFGPRKDSSRPGVGTADEHPWSFARAEIHTRMWMAKGLRKRRDILERL